MVTTKYCNKCSTEKDLDEFHKRAKNKKDGRQPWCKECHAVYDARYFVDNREHHYNNQNKWRLENKDKVNAKVRKKERQDVKTLSDTYIMKTFRKSKRYIHPSKVTPEMIAARRLELENKRKYIKKNGQVYFLLCRDRIKIGFSTKLERRIDDLQGANAFSIHLLASFAGTPRNEKKVHKLFKDERIHREWFHYSARLRKYIKLCIRKDRICRGL